MTITIGKYLMEPVNNVCLSMFLEFLLQLEGRMTIQMI